MKRAKNYKKINESVKKANDLKSYLEAVCENNPYKFDQSIELKIAVKRSGKNATPYKVSVTYPNNFGKDVKVLVLAEGEDAKKASAAGADFVGLEDMAEKIMNENFLDFDVVIATPAVMPKIAKLGRVLGTKGLMPNPKTGTVVTDVTAAVSEFKAGRKNFKEDKSGVINTVVAKVSQGAEKSIENLKTLVNAIKESAPNLFNEVNSIHIKTTMGPSVKVTTGELMGI
jgi:large subunit ribosomal protein L1